MRAVNLRKKLYCDDNKITKRAHGFETKRGRIIFDTASFLRVFTCNY
jgi:hypothetical protein